MKFKTPQTLLNAVTTAQVEAKPLLDMDFRLRDWLREKLALEVSGTFTGVSLQPRQSMDGVTWWPIGSAITAAGLTVLEVDLPYFDVSLTAIASGSVTVRAM